MNGTLSIFITCEDYLIVTKPLHVLFVRSFSARLGRHVYLRDMWSAFFVHLKKSWFESHNYSDKERRLTTRSPVQPQRKENGTSYIDLASQQAYSLVQSCAFGHVHEVVHTLRHLLAEAIDIVVIVHPCRCGFEAPLVVIH